jgi:2-isopropylmalate synthase
VLLSHEDGRQACEAAVGEGPVHAVMHAIERATGHTLVIDSFQVRSLSLGADAQGQATLTVKHAGREVRGNGVSTDVIEAAALAALEAINRIERLGGAPRIPAPASASTLLADGPSAAATAPAMSALAQRLPSARHAIHSS